MQAPEATLLNTQLGGFNVKTILLFCCFMVLSPTSVKADMLVRSPQPEYVDFTSDSDFLILRDFNRDREFRFLIDQDQNSDRERDFRIGDLPVHHGGLPIPHDQQPVPTPEPDTFVLLAGLTALVLIKKHSG